MKCGECRHWQSNGSPSMGICSFVLPQYLRETNERIVAEWQSCSFWDARPGKRGRPRKEVMENEDADE